MKKVANEAYALAKISGLKYCEFLNKQYGTDYISVMPTNLYGPNDNYHPENSHVVPALIRRFHEARERNAGWRIDYFLVSDRLVDKIASAEILNDVYGSDHCPVEIVTNNTVL